jgi:hypothetical protein
MIKITVNCEDAIRKLSDLKQRQIPFALAKALTRTAIAVSKREQQEITRVFDRPTPFTVNSVYVIAATKQNLTAIVRIKDEASKGVSPAKYLRAEIFGGPRGMKASESLLRRSGLLGANEFMVPSNYIQLDAYGNVPKGTMTNVLSGVKAYLALGFNQNRTKAWKRGKIGKAGPWVGGYFVVSRKTGQLRRHSRPLPNGIWQRARDNDSIKPLFFFVRQPFYLQRFKFYEIATQVVQEQFDRIFAQSLEDALRTAR